MRFRRTVGLMSAACVMIGCAGPSQLQREAASAEEVIESGVYLYGANLKGADLQGVELYRCQLGQADLSNADLRNASLAGAYLFKADLRGADLRGAKFAPPLDGAELKQTGLVGARFDATTQLPFSRDEALRRGMISMEPSQEVASRF